MGSILGTAELPSPKTEKLFSISTAEVTLETKFNLKHDGSASGLHKIRGVLQV